jgi:molybdopterin molybdotransferase
VLSLKLGDFVKFDDVRLKGFSKRIKLSEAIKRCIDSLPMFPGVEVDLKTTTITNRVLKENIYAKRSIPPFKRSAVDGYAVKGQDTTGASESNPIVLKVVDELYIGEFTSVILESNTAIQIPTGGVVPKGADAVVMVEDTGFVSEESRIIEVYTSVHPGKNIAKEGEDLEKNQLLFRVGRKFKTVDRGYLLSAGINSVEISSVPKIAIFSTGNELVDPWKSLEMGKIPDVNSINLYEACLNEDWSPNILGIIPDSETSLREAIESACNNYDIVLLSGGSSVGEKDYIPVILNDLGELLFHGIAMRPGGPIAAARINNSRVFGLPGFPAATLIAFEFLLKPVIYYLMGMNQKYQPFTVEVEITRNVGSKLGRLDFLRIQLEKTREGIPKAVPIQIGGSGLLRSIVHGNGIIPISEASEGLKEGDIVEAIVLGGDYINFKPLD